MGELILRLTNDELKILRELVITERTEAALRFRAKPGGVNRFAVLQGIERKLAEAQPGRERPNPVPARDLPKSPFAHRDPKLTGRR